MMADSANVRNREVHTIGHSNHSVELFLGLLERHSVDKIVDVRSSPYSRYAFSFNQEALEQTLERHGIHYLFLGDLIGGRPEETRFYDPEGYVRYDWLAQSPRFQRGLARLVEEIEVGRVALLCGEEDPTGCHRRLLIGRVLAENGITVLHIRGDGRVQSEKEVAEEERLSATKGQLFLFPPEEKTEWRSSRSVLPKRAPRSSSEASDEWEPGE